MASWSTIRRLVFSLESSRGQPDGIATLDGTGNVPVEQLGNATGGGGGSLTVVEKTHGIYDAASGEFVIFTGFSIDDGDLTEGEPVLTSAAGVFTSELIGVPVDDFGWNQEIPSDSVVVSVESPTSLTMSNNATGGDADDTVAFGLLVNLPDPNAGSRVSVKRVAESYGDGTGGRLEIVASSGTIDGEAQVSLAARFDTVTLVGDGTDWRVETVSPPQLVVAKGDGRYSVVQAGAGGSATGYASISLGGGTATNGAIAFHSGHATASNSFAEGGGTASGDVSHAEGQATASGIRSHAEGLAAQATADAAHAEGRDTHATGDYSHAEGYAGTASGEAAHAEGFYTQSGGYAAHAEGRETHAPGYAAHSEGWTTRAEGAGSHAAGTCSAAWADWMWSFSSGGRGIGCSQYSFWIPYNSTTDSTPTPLGVVAGGDLGAGNPQPPDSFALTWPHAFYAVLVEARVVARRRDIPGTASAWDLTILVDGNYDGETSTYRIVGTQDKAVVAQDSAAASWDVNLSLDGSGRLVVTVTGEDGATIDWTCTLKFYEVAA